MVNWEIGIDIYMLLCIKEVTNENLLYLVLCGKEIQRRGNICIYMADSFCCRAETDTAV